MMMQYVYEIIKSYFLDILAYLIVFAVGIGIGSAITDFLNRGK